MTIGNVTIAGKAALAPMAGVADRAFRKLCVENGAAYVVGEMVSCKGLCFGDAKSEELLSLDPQEHPAAIQLFGDDQMCIRDSPSPHPVCAPRRSPGRDCPHPPRS